MGDSIATTANHRRPLQQLLLILLLLLLLLPSVVLILRVCMPRCHCDGAGDSGVRCRMCLTTPLQQGGITDGGRPGAISNRRVRRRQITRNRTRKCFNHCLDNQPDDIWHWRGEGCPRDLSQSIIVSQCAGYGRESATGLNRNRSPRRGVDHRHLLASLTCSAIARRPRRISLGTNGKNGLGCSVRGNQILGRRWHVAYFRESDCGITG
jgi:hypothetical protein